MSEFVLTLVLRVEKGERPGQTDALETAARAVLAILADERSAGDGEWAEAMRDWQDARIRKVARRARGIEWRRASALPGITVSSARDPLVPAEAENAAEAEIRAKDGEAAKNEARAGAGVRAEAGEAAKDGARAAAGVRAEVRVFPPVPVDQVPRDLAKLQVAGTDLEDPEPSRAPDPSEPVLWVNPGLEMSTGKKMAQVGHGAHLAWLALSASDRKTWQADGFPLAVRTATTTRWNSLLTSGLPVVQDAGFTEVEPGSRTVIADHPALREPGR